MFLRPFFCHGDWATMSPAKPIRGGRTMQVSEILAIKGTVLYTIAPDKTLDHAVSVMSDLDVGSLVCFAGGRMVGMLTFREVLKAVNANGAKWGSVKVDEVMVHD